MVRKTPYPPYERDIKNRPEGVKVDEWWLAVNIAYGVDGGIGDAVPGSERYHQYEDYISFNLIRWMGDV